MVWLWYMVTIKFVQYTLLYSMQTLLVHRKQATAKSTLVLQFKLLETQATRGL